MVRWSVTLSRERLVKRCDQLVRRVEWERESAENMAELLGVLLGRLR